MNVTIIYGSSDFTACNYTHFLINRLHTNLPVSLTEYFLYEDIFYKNLTNQSCTKYNSSNINNIIQSISDSDLIIFACLNFGKQLLTPQLKILIKHLNHIWHSNKINIPMNRKIVLIMSDNYIPFFPSTYKILKKNIKSYGFKNILNFSLKSCNNTFKADAKEYKNYINLMFLSLEILKLIYTDNNFLSIRSHNIIQFPYSRLVNNKINKNKNESVNKVIPMKNI